MRSHAIVSRSAALETLMPMSTCKQVAPLPSPAPTKAVKQLTWRLSLSLGLPTPGLWEPKMAVWQSLLCSLLSHPTTNLKLQQHVRTRIGVKTSSLEVFIVAFLKQWLLLVVQPRGPLYQAHVLPDGHPDISAYSASPCQHLIRALNFIWLSYEKSLMKWLILFWLFKDNEDPFGSLCENEPAKSKVVLGLIELKFSSTKKVLMTT
jgi:hypothetical protein